MSKISVSISVLYFMLQSLLTSTATAGNLGVYLEDYGDGQGARITQTVPNSSAQRMICPDCNKFHYLSSSNVIIAINGQRVRDSGDARKLLASSPREAEITVLNLDRGSERTYRTKLTAQSQSKRGNGRSWSFSNNDNSSPSWSNPTPDSSSSDSLNMNSLRRQMEMDSFNRNYSRNPNHSSVYP
jgi:hypothetical protein